MFVVVLFIGAVIYAVGVFIAYGLSFGYWQSKYPERAMERKQEDMEVSAGWSVFSWLTVIAVLILTRKWYWKL